MLLQGTSQRPLTIMAIDPGTSSLGVAIMSWDLESSYIVVETAMTLQAKNSVEYKALTETQGPRVARLIQFQEQLSSILEDNRPHEVIAESPYLGRFPEAFAALVETFYMIRQTLEAYNPLLKLEKIDPTTAKKAVGVVIKKKKKSKKEDVTKALAKRKDIEWRVDLFGLDEHATDAVAVGYYYFSTLR